MNAEIFFSGARVGRYHRATRWGFYVFVYLRKEVQGWCSRVKSKSLKKKKKVFNILHVLLFFSTGLVRLLHRRSSTEILLDYWGTFCAFFVWQQQDSNPRPFHNEADALPLRYLNPQMGLLCPLDFYVLCTPFMSS